MGGAVYTNEDAERANREGGVNAPHKIKLTVNGLQMDGQRVEARYATDKDSISVVLVGCTSITEEACRKIMEGFNKL